MADEHENENTEKVIVELTQEKIDALIGEGFSKGASKAEKTLLEALGVENIDALKKVITDKQTLEDANKTELEKSVTTINDLEGRIVSLTGKYDDLLKTNDVDKVALANGVKDVEVFNMLYTQAAKVEGFDKVKFIEGLKETRGYLFGEAPREDILNPKPNEKNQKGAITRLQYEALDPASAGKFIADGGTVTN